MEKIIRRKKSSDLEVKTCAQNPPTAKDHDLQLKGPEKARAESGS